MKIDTWTDEPGTTTRIMASYSGINIYQYANGEINKIHLSYEQAKMVARALDATPRESFCKPPRPRDEDPWDA